MSWAGHGLTMGSCVREPAIHLAGHGLAGMGWAGHGQTMLWAGHGPGMGWARSELVTLWDSHGSAWAGLANHGLVWPRTSHWPCWSAGHVPWTAQRCPVLVMALSGQGIGCS